jgi:alpha-glucosidase
MNRHHLLIFLLLSVASLSWAQKSFQVQSPSGEFTVSVKVGDSIYYSVTANQRPVINPSTIALITQTVSFGIRSTVRRNVSRSVNEIILNPIPFKRKKIADHYNELTLDFRENFSLVFRAYNDGVGYRFISAMNDSIQINKEIASFRFNESDSVYFPQVQKRDNLDTYHTSFEEPYRKEKLSALRSTDLGFSPVLIRGKVNVVITESDLWDYPGMFLRGTGKNELRGDFAAYPDKEEIQGGEFKQPVVVTRKNFIARSPGRRTFPWRVIVLAKEDKDLLSNDLVYRLGKPPLTLDWSWVQPGISTEEWISGSNIYGVNFESGINTATYKYYIDFASRFGMQYVMLDAGWSDYNDLFRITPGLDLEELSAYAKTKNIGLILWTLSMTLDRQLEQALTLFNKLGVKAIMTDFMDRDDQKIMTFYQRIAEATARHKIMVMFHGAFKNAGFERTFPNAITREAVLGSEYNIWSEKASPEHDLLIPFIRMVSGPMDYEPGSMINANKRTFRALPDKVMSQGTRCHQLAMFVAYDSPLQMFSGNPSDAWKEIDFTTFLASLPTVWDETVVLDGKLGDYLILARRKDSDWYVTAMTDWTPREFEVDLSFLEKGQFRAFTVADGVNASQDASDYQMGYELVGPNKKLKIKMAPGGGYVAKLIRLNDARP